MEIKIIEARVRMVIGVIRQGCIAQFQLNNPDATIEHVYDITSRRIKSERKEIIEFTVEKIGESIFHVIPKIMSNHQAKVFLLKD